MINPIRADNLAAVQSATHGFFTREGGVSGGIYHGLNVGLGSNDDPADVRENRSLVAAALGHPGKPLNTLRQSHTADAIVVDAPFEGEPPQADALVTSTPGLVIGALAADCTPVLFCDPEARVIAAAHAGWRGALAGILEATLAAMVNCGAKIARIRAAIGPTISQDSYEVGPEFEERFLRKSPVNKRFFTRNDAGSRPHFDLPGYVHDRLMQAGLANIEHQALCTYKNESRLFSYRRSQHRCEPDYGRQISAIVLN